MVEPSATAVTRAALSAGNATVTFEVPAGLGGHFDVGLARSWRSLIGETGLLVVLVALALPTLGGRTAARRGL